MSQSGKKRPLTFVLTAVAVLAALVACLAYAFLPPGYFGNTASIKEKMAGSVSWSELGESQRRALALLENDWDSLSSEQKSKWLEIADRMESMSAEERARFENHVRDWLSLTPEQRQIARQNFLGFRKIDADKKKEKWNEYQKLPEEKKRALAARARLKRRLTNLSDKTEKPAVVELPVKQPEKAPVTAEPEEIPEYWR